MKTTIRTITAAALLAVTALISSSCLKDTGYYYGPGIFFADAVVTVKPLDDQGSSFYMQLDDNTTLLPVGYGASPYKGDEVRAFVKYTEVGGDAGEYDKAVKLIWIESLLTKEMAPDKGSNNAYEYGSDPVEIIKGFPTVVEDGYMTLGFITYSAGFGGQHDVNLIYTGNPDATEDSEKYVVEFRHDANGDTYGKFLEGYVAFRLDGVDGLPDTEGKTVKLTLKWDSIRYGDRSVQFDYCTRESSGEIDGAGDAEGTDEGIDTSNLLKLQ